MLPLIAALFLIFVTNLITGCNHTFGDYIQNLLSVQYIFGAGPLVDPLWSLPYEVWFYILLGFLALFINKKSVVSLVLFILFVIVYFSNFTILYLVIWIIGAFASQLNVQKTNKRVLILSLCGIIFCSMLIFAKDMILDTMQVKGDTYDIVLYLVYALFAGFMIKHVSLLEPQHKVSLFFHNWGVKLSVFSYTLYLSHWSVMELLDFFGLPHFTEYSVISLLMLVGYSLIAMLVAYLLYLCFEKHTYFVKKHLYGLLKVS